MIYLLALYLHPGDKKLQFSAAMLNYAHSGI